MVEMLVTLHTFLYAGRKRERDGHSQLNEWEKDKTFAQKPN